MKKFIYAVLISVLLVMAVPATAFADTGHRGNPPRKTPISAELAVMAVGRDTVQTVTRFGVIIHGTVTYQGYVVDSSFDPLDNALLQAEEEVLYVTDLSGNIRIGIARGTVTLFGGSGQASVNFLAKVTGNIATGPAFDDGRWKVDDVAGSFAGLWRGQGSWTAAVQLVPTGYPPPNDYTFAGSVFMNGTY
jgi:hypothetical protein